MTAVIRLRWVLEMETLMISVIMVWGGGWWWWWWWFVVVVMVILLWEFCVSMIGRADIERSKSNVAMNAWLPQASYPCGNFSDTSSWTALRLKGSIGHAFTVCTRTENQNQASFSPFGQHEISVLIELALGHLRYHLTDVPPQPNSPPD